MISSKQLQLRRKLSDYIETNRLFSLKNSCNIRIHPSPSISIFWEVMNAFKIASPYYRNITLNTFFITSNTFSPLAKAADDMH